MQSLSLLLLLLVSIKYTLATKQGKGSRRYSRWDGWSACPSKCRIICSEDCIRTRSKSCIRPEVCGSQVIRAEKTCGRCERAGGSQSTQIPVTQPVSSVPLPPIDNRNLPLVSLESHCLQDYHFSEWGDWSECLSVCRKVRFRHCTTSLCKQRVPHMEDAAVKQEQWCVPPSQSSQAQNNESGNQDGDTAMLPNCEKYSAYMNMVNNKHPTYFNLKQCVRARRKQDINMPSSTADSGVQSQVTPPSGSVLNLNTSCGLRNTPSRSLRIIGGKAAKKGQWPWQVAIMLDKRENDFSDFPRDQQIYNPREYFNYTDEPNYVQFCGGTLINEQWVLTAAHCVKQRETGLRKPNMVVMVGETNMRVMNHQSTGWQDNIYKISKVIDHSKFEWDSVNNDIALLKLEKAVPISSDIGFSCVPDETLEAEPRTECIAVGWGKHRKQRASKKLKEAILPLVSRQECKDAFNFTITKNQMCAGYKDGRSDSCDGDSGGPLMCLASTPSGQRWVTYGITSFGSNDGCGIAGKYGVYTKVNNYANWIKYAIETGTQLHETSIPEPRKRRHNHKYNSHLHNTQYSSSTSVEQLEEKLSLIDSLYSITTSDNQRSLREHPT